LHLEAASAATAKAMLAVERRLQQSPFGKHILQTGRVLTNINVMRALDTFGAAADAFDAYEHSKNQSAPGKQINAQLGGYLSLGAARSGLTAADPVLGKVFGKANTVGSFYRGVADTISAYVDVAFKHDSDALNAVHKANMSGKYGSVLQGYAMIGDVISKSGWIDNKISYAADRMSGVPKDFRTSLVWWGSH
jgi:hypothetical protein